MHILITSVIDLRKTSYSRLHHFISHLLSKRHKITVISIKDNWKHKGAQQNEELCSKLKIIYITEKQHGAVRQKISAAFSSKKLLAKAGKPDIHFCYNSLILGYLIGKELKKKGINTVYDLADDLPEMINASPHIPLVLRPIGGVVGKIMLRKSLAMAKAVTYTAKEFETSMDIKRYNSFLLPNGVDVKRFTPGTVRHQGIVVGYVGALREWVDLRPMLTAVKRLRTKLDVRVLIVGGEEDLPQYREFVKQNGMNAYVKFTGNVPYKDVQRYVKMMDICTVPFRKNRVTDGTNPLKLLEYLASGKPAICSSLNEPKSMLGDNILYADNEDEWEGQIMLLAKDTKLRLWLGREGRKIVLKEYDWKRICVQLEDILQAMK